MTNKAPENSVWIGPSVLSADFLRLGEQLEELEVAGADYIHFDAMDGRFVPNFSIGLPVLEAVRRGTTLPVDAHLMMVEPERWIDVTWDIDEDNPQRFPAKITVTALNEPGSLAQVAAVIGEADGNIDNIKMTNRVPDYTEMMIDLEVWDLKHLNEIIAGLRAKDVVSSAARASA